MHPIRRLPAGLALVAATAALSLSMAPAALAARGGGHTSATPTASLVSSCDPCSAGTVVQFTGAGYNGSQPSAQLNFNGDWAAIPVNADGTISFGWNVTATGSYTVKVYQYGKGGKLALMGETTFVVQ
jgi:hypothetical protein